MVVGDDDQSIYRFRGASYAAFVEFDRRFAARPPHDPTGHAPGPPPRLRLEENFRSTEPHPHGRQPAHRAQRARATRPTSSLRPTAATGRSRSSSSSRPTSTTRRARSSTASRPRRLGPGDRRTRRRPTGRTTPSSTASTDIARRSSTGCARRASRTASSAGCRSSRRRRSATSSRACARSRTRSTTSRSSG